MISSRISKSVLIALLALSAPASFATSGTIRVRFVNGKSGKPLHVKYMEVGRGGFAYKGYTVDRVETDGLTVTFHDVSHFSLESEGYHRCDAKKESDPPTQFDISEILSSGVVAPNYCGTAHAQPAKGELILYSRKARFWESISNLRGLFICG